MVLRVYCFDRYFRKATRAQLNIAEVAVSATIIFVMAVSLAQVGVKIAESNQPDRLDGLKQKAKDVLSVALAEGFLRELVYASQPSSLPAQSQMTALLEATIPARSEYSLYQRTLDGSAHSWNNRVLAGLNPPPSGEPNILSVSVAVTGYSNTTASFSTAFIVTLLMTVGD